MERDLPPAPRSVRWRAALRAHWLAGAFGIALAVSGLPLVVIAFALDMDITSIADMELDNAASETVGRVDAIEQPPLGWGERAVIRYSFELPTRSGESRRWLDGSLLANPAGLEVDGECTVEFLAHDPEVNRLHGSRRQLFGRLGDILIGMLMLPGIALIFVWLRGATRLRLLLRNGTTAIARIQDCRYVFAVNPPQLRVAFEYTDETRRDRKSSHWVGQRSELGRALRQDDGSTASTATVIYAPENPDHCRLASPADFTEG